jgi:hypothetical protein
MIPVRKPFTVIAAALLGIIALVHLLRLIVGFDVVIGGTSVPQWASVPGLLIAGCLALMLWREARA